LLTPFEKSLRQRKVSRKIREDLIALCASGAVQSPEDLNVYFGEHGAELAYLLRLYKASFFYSGDLQIDFATMIKLDEEN
jgi:hypothetical protein